MLNAWNWLGEKEIEGGGESPCPPNEFYDRAKIGNFSGSPEKKIKPER